MAVGDDIETSKGKIDDSTASLQAYNTALTNTNTTLQGFSGFLNKAGDALRDLTGGLKLVSDAQQHSHILMQDSTKLLGLMGSAALGASRAFTSMSDTSGISSFGDQISELVETASRAHEPISALSQVTSTFGLNIVKRADESITQFASRIANAAKEMLQGQDAALKFQNSFLQMSAASGNLGKVFQQTGGDLQHINDLLQTQGLMLANAAAATNTDTKVTSEYYTALGKIPGYLNQQITATDGAGNSLNVLTAAMKIAHGTGRDQADILRDLTTAYENYDASADKALDFTARISELSQKYNLRLQDTQEYMTRTAGAFKFLGENVDSSAKMFEAYFSRLRDTGLSTRAAVEITDDMSESLSKMTVAQKAFLSARTGGPGGLMGAVQIEQQIRSGDMAGVMKRLEDALKQQFGRIVTQQEATTSEQAAAQFVKQRMLLTQGPFGALTGGDEGKATRLLEAMAKPGGVGTITQEKAQDLLRNDIKKGSDVEQKSHTILTQLNTRVEAIKMLSGIIALGVTQRAITTAGGPETAVGRQLLGGIKDAMESGRRATGQGAETAQDRSSLYMSEGIRGVYQVLDGLKVTGQSIDKATTATATTKNEMMREQATTHARNTADVRRVAAQNMHTQPITVKHDTRVADALMAASKKPTVPPPTQRITVTLNSVCPDCHKKYVTNQQQTAINNAPGQFGAGF